jgi:hypothetical protein
MTKLYHRKARVALFFVTLVLSLSCILLYSKELINNSTERQPFTIVGPPIGGEDVTLAQAQASEKFKVSLPTELGEFTQMKMNKDSGTLTIIYASNKPSADVSINDVISENGIILIEAPNTLTPQSSTQNIMDAINATKNDVGGLQLVNINGNLGCAGGNIQHNVFWYTATNSYELIANLNYPMEQLLKIAESIPTK